VSDTPTIIRALWDEGRHTTADIARMVGLPEALVAGEVSRYVARKARARAASPFRAPAKTE
jgi:hypothetical protein